MLAHDVTKINRDFQYLAPFFSQLLQQAITECQDQGLPIYLFEGYRCAARQGYLFEQGRSREGKIITKARPGHSWHQYGVAADLCFKHNGQWAWHKDDPWDKVHQVMHDFGFETLSWEKAHVQWVGEMTIAKAKQITQDHGLLVLWTMIEGNKSKIQH